MSRALLDVAQRRPGDVASPRFLEQWGSAVIDNNALLTIKMARVHLTRSDLIHERHRPVTRIT
jgi:hypothetical protein